MAPNRSKHQGKAQPTMPSFDQNALSKLTAKIDQNLEAAKGKQKAERGEQKAEKGEKREHGGDDKDPRPKKRQAHSDVPQSTNGDHEPTKPQKNDKKAELLEEIKALGGDEADLDLIAGVDSDAEEGQGKAPERPVDEGFKHELAKFASGLGFEKFRDEDIVNEEQHENGDEESEDIDEDVENSHKVSAATAAEQVDPAKPPRNKRLAKLIFEPRPDWHTVNQDNLPAPSSDDIRNFSSAISNLKVLGNSLLENDATAYSAAMSSSSSHRFMSTIMKDGTMSDRVSALTLEIQESPVHNVKAFESLINLASKRNRTQAIAALGALVDLLGNGVALPADRRLRPFHLQPGLVGSLQAQSGGSWKSGQKLPGKMKEPHLMMWVFEDWLKEAYFKVIQLLEGLAGDEIEYSRSRAIDYIFGLLRDKPEQEANLLRLLINKLGDRERKIASRASYLVLQLLNVHPGMKAVVIRTIEEETLLRSGQSVRTKYYAINTLNQTILSNKEPDIAESLTRIYFELFVSLLKSGSLGAVDIPSAANMPSDEPETAKSQEKGRAKKRVRVDDTKSGSERDTAEKLVSAILTGINRAIPFAMTDETTLETHLDTLFRITHSSNFNTSVQALMLIQQVATSKLLAIDRFYRTLYESLLDPRLVSSSKQALYLNLLYRSLKNDLDVRRVKAFVKRMLQVIGLHQPSFMCGILFLIAELESTFPDLKALLTEPEDNDDDGEIHKDGDDDGVVDNTADPESVIKRQHGYDGRKRNPEYSNAQESCLWELMPLLEHYHPTVAAFALNLLVRQSSLPKPDLANHTLIHFLDRFVYRNPKATESKRGASIMQPVLAAGSSAHIVNPGKGTKHQPSVNSAAFWNKKAEDIAAEDVFFHEYFSQTGKPGQAAKAQTAKTAKTLKKRPGEETDSEAEDEIWQALVDSRPEIEGDEDEDVDMDMDMSEEDDAELQALLNMSDSDDEETSEMDDDIGSAASDGEVEFFDFSDEDKSEASDGHREPATPTTLSGKQGRERKKELKALPTFASADDYAEMLAAEADEDYS